MSVSSVPPKTRILLWGKAAGRCQYQGCNVPLWQDPLKKTEFNSAYIAHIIADKPDGPRGDKVLSEKLKCDLSNLMILCDPCHRRIDKVEIAEHPPELLRAMKQQHEDRIALLGSLQPNRQSEVLLYGARIGEHGSKLSFEQATQGMLPEWYPASGRGVQLGMLNVSIDDGEAAYWQVQSENLQRLVKTQLSQRMEMGEIQHLSVFGLAPQPLLMLVGSLLTDIPTAEVYHLFREPADWRWREHPDDFKLIVERPSRISGPPALILGLSATITRDRIERVLDTDAAIWTITVPEPKHDAIPSRQGLSEFRQQVRRLLDEIKAKHGQDTELHVFPAMGVSTAIELGRVRQPKADMPFRIYDQNAKLGGFQYALTVGSNTKGGI